MTNTNTNTNTKPKNDLDITIKPRDILSKQERDFLLDFCANTGNHERRYGLYVDSNYSD